MRGHIPLDLAEVDLGSFGRVCQILWRGQWVRAAYDGGPCALSRTTLAHYNAAVQRSDATLSRRDPRLTPVGQAAGTAWHLAHQARKACAQGVGGNSAWASVRKWFVGGDSLSVKKPDPAPLPIMRLPCAGRSRRGCMWATSEVDADNRAGRRQIGFACFQPKAIVHIRMMKMCPQPLALLEPSLTRWARLWPRLFCRLLAQDR